MEHFCCCIKKTRGVCNSSYKVTRLVVFRAYRLLLSKTNSLSLCLSYMLSLSLFGFVMLKAWKPRTTSYTPRNIDYLFTSVSAATVSSMMTVEMEVFSQPQLIVMTALMLLGGEIFTSMFRLHFTAKPFVEGRVVDSVESPNSGDQIQIIDHVLPVSQSNFSFLKYDSIRFLGILVLGYVLVIQILGVAAVVIYFSLVSSAENVLKNKGIQTSVFAVFTVVSTFANCGFIPTNENLIVFSKNTGLLLILIPQILLGNTLFPSAMRVVIWLLGKKFKRNEAEYLLENTREVGFPHLLPRLQSVLLAATVLGFLFTTSVLFASLEWHTVGLDGLNTYRKVVGVIFQSANARHAGENIVDLSTIAPAVLLFFILMMLVSLFSTLIN